MNIVEQCRQEGEQRGEAKLLRKLLRLKFGEALPSWADARIEAASSAKLEAWAEQVLFADTLEGVLGPKG